MELLRYGQKYFKINGIHDHLCATGAFRPRIARDIMNNFQPRFLIIPNGFLMRDYCNIWSYKKISLTGPVGRCVLCCYWKINPRKDAELWLRACAEAILTRSALLFTNPLYLLYLIKKISFYKRHPLDSTEEPNVPVRQVSEWNYDVLKHFIFYLMHMDVKHADERCRINCPYGPCFNSKCFIIQ